MSEIKLVMKEEGDNSETKPIYIPIKDFKGIATYCGTSKITIYQGEGFYLYQTEMGCMLTKEPLNIKNIENIGPCIEIGDEYVRSPI